MNSLDSDYKGIMCDHVYVVRFQSLSFHLGGNKMETG